MKNAYECREEFTAEGKCLKRERTVGPIVPWTLVAIIGIVFGKALSPSIWQLFKP